MENYVSGSNFKAWWLCPIAEDHYWVAPIDKRAKRGDGCPFCSAHRPSSTNNLLLLNPRVAAQLNEEKSGYTATQLTVGSNKKVWWTCEEKQHEWDASPNTRLTRGCPHCSNKATGERLLYENTIAGKSKRLTAEFDLTKNNTTPNKVNTGSAKKYYWLCADRGHSWQSSAAARFNVGQNCPYCSNKRVGADNNLAFLFPEIASQLDENISGIKSNQIVPGSGKKVTWNCAENTEHSWVSDVRNRTGHNVHKIMFGCPDCTQAHTSNIEILLRKRASAILLNMPEDYKAKLDIPWRRNKRMSVDILGEYDGKKVAIEYDGMWYHYDKETILRDLAKTEALLNAGYIVVRIREGKLPDLELTSPQLLQLNYKYSSDENKINELIKNIETHLKLMTGIT